MSVSVCVCVPGVHNVNGEEWRTLSAVWCSPFFRSLSFGHFRLFLVLSS